MQCTTPLTLSACSLESPVPSTCKRAVLQSSFIRQIGFWALNDSLETNHVPTAVAENCKSHF